MIAKTPKKTVEPTLSSGMPGGNTGDANRIKANLGLVDGLPTGAPEPEGVQKAGKPRGPYKKGGIANSEAAELAKKYISDRLCTRMVRLPYKTMGFATGSKIFSLLPEDDEYLSETGEALKDVLLLFDLIKDEKDTIKWFALAFLAAEFSAHFGERVNRWRQELKEFSGVRKPTTPPKNGLSPESSEKPGGEKGGSSGNI